LRYPGGKAKIYDKVKNIILVNALSDKIYVEPFAGGFGLGLKLMRNGDIDRFIINDYDRHIFAFWKSVFCHTNKLKEKIITTSITVEEWQRQKGIYKDYKNFSLLEVGFSTLFLNRTNFSGILMGGPIGGLDQCGKYKLHCRFNKGKIIALIKEIAKHKDKVEIYNKDAVKLIRDLKNRESELFYNFDPPYVNKGKELYLNAFIAQDHTDLRNEINNVQTKWIMTYDNVDLIKDLYCRYNQTQLSLIYSVSSKRKEKELMISNLNFIV
jgi:DNA adenine methylase